MEDKGNIRVLADLTMNLYFQDYATDAEFFDIEDFVTYVGISYADLIGQEYDLERRRMMAEGENSDTISFSHDWLKTEVLQREEDKEGFFIKLTQPVMSFPYDKRDVGIQNLFPLGSQFNCELIRGSIDDMFLNEFLPLTNKVFWALLGDKIYLTTNFTKPPKEIRIVYVPSVSPLLDIPASRQKMVMENTIKSMRGAAAGYIVKETNDQNLNETQISDVNRTLIKP